MGKQTYDRPTEKFGEHLQDALVHAENIERLSKEEKKQIHQLLNQAAVIATREVVR